MPIAAYDDPEEDLKRLLAIRRPEAGVPPEDPEAIRVPEAPQAALGEQKAEVSSYPPVAPPTPAPAPAQPTSQAYPPLHPAQDRYERLLAQGEPQAQGFRQKAANFFGLGPKWRYTQDLARSERGALTESTLGERAAQEQERIAGAEERRARAAKETAVANAPAKPVKPDTIEQQYADALEEVDAAKTPQEKAAAEAKVARLERAANVKTKPAAQSAGTEEEQFIKQYLADNKLPDTAANRLIARGKFMGAGREPKDTTGKDEARLDKSFQFNSGRLDKLRTPIESQAERIARLNASVEQHNPQADALIAPELLTAMAGGMGSGLRMNEAEISRIVGGRSNWESLKASLNKWRDNPQAVSITDSQREQIRRLVGVTQKRINDELAAIDEAAEKIVNADSVKEHRVITNALHKRLAEINSGGNAVGGQATGEADLGPAPKGKAEGSTGTLPDGTKIVIRGGRVIRQ